jgi:hypothetical protein
MAETLQLHVSDLLYRTRGHDWDYAFLLQPEPLLGEGWYALHRRIFANVEPSETPVLLRGQLAIGTGQPFFATAFTDATRRDYQDRAVAHYIAWFGKEAEAAPGLSFGPGVVAALGSALDHVFGLAPEAVKRGETKPLDALVRARFQTALPAGEVLSVGAEASRALRWLGSVAP